MACLKGILGDRGRHLADEVVLEEKGEFLHV
jgi:hypothetical protein